MVFGWGKKKEVPQEHAEPIRRDIAIEDVEGILRGLTDARAEALVAQAAAFRRVADSQMSEIGRIAVELEGDDLNVDDIDSHLKVIVVRGKRQVISIIKEEAARGISGVGTVEEVVALSGQLGRSLKRVGDVLGRQSRVIHIFAKKYAGKLKSILSELKEGQESIQSLVDGYKKLEEGTVQIRRDIKGIKETKGILGQKSARLTSLEKSLTGFDEKTKRLSSEMETIKKSEEYSGMVRVQEKIKALKGQRHALQREINDSFTRVSRPLGKYEYVSSLDRDQKGLLRDLISDPFAAMSGGKKNDIITILQHTRKGVVSGAVSVKDADKAVQSLDEASEALDSQIRQKEQLGSKEAALLTELRAFDTSKYEGMQAELDRARFDRAEASSKIQQIKTEVEEASRRIKGLYADVERTLRTISSTKYTIQGREI